MSFANLKRSSGKSMAKITSAMEKLNQKNFSSDDNDYWKPTVDKAGNGYAVIRFLPAKTEEDLPYVLLWDHGFQGPGGWYIENSLTTLGQDDPVSEYNSKLWNSTQDDNHPNRKQARDQKRRTNYHAYIYVVEDSANPATEGKVFKYKFGKKIFDKIKDVMHPEFEDEEAVNPFDLWNGANFKIKIRQVDGWRNYDKSEFDTPGPLKDNDDELEEIYNQIGDLQELLAPSNFKSYDELKTKLYRVLGEDPDPVQSDRMREEQAPSRQETTSETVNDDMPPFETDDEDEDDLEFFKNFAED